MTPASMRKDGKPRQPGTAGGAGSGQQRDAVRVSATGEHIQTGIVAVASVDAYEADLIKKHEFTRPDKEDDRVRRFARAQVGPVFVTARPRRKLMYWWLRLCCRTLTTIFRLKTGPIIPFGQLGMRKYCCS